MINKVRHFVSLTKRRNANLSLLIEYNIRVDAYIPELPADKTDVNITFINDAAKARPAFEHKCKWRSRNAISTAH